MKVGKSIYTTGNKAYIIARPYIEAFYGRLANMGVKVGELTGAFVILERMNPHGKFNYGLGKERTWTYEGQFNLFGGKIDKCEDVLIAAMRELAEEGKVYFNDIMDFINAITNDDGAIRFMVKGTTIIFICKSNTSGDEIYKRIHAAANDTSLKYHLREMVDFCYSDLNGKLEKGGAISEFAESVLNKYRDNKVAIDSGTGFRY